MSNVGAPVASMAALHYLFRQVDAEKADASV